MRKGEPEFVTNTQRATISYVYDFPSLCVSLCIPVDDCCLRCESHERQSWTNVRGIIFSFRRRVSRSRFPHFLLFSPPQCVNICDVRLSSSRFITVFHLESSPRRPTPPIQIVAYCYDFLHSVVDVFLLFSQNQSASCSLGCCPKR